VELIGKVCEWDVYISDQIMPLESVELV